LRDEKTNRSNKMIEKKVNFKTEKGKVYSDTVKIWICKRFEDWAGKPHGFKPEVTNFDYIVRIGSVSKSGTYQFVKTCVEGDDARYLDIARKRLEGDPDEFVNILKDAVRQFNDGPFARNKHEFVNVD
jgi:hypothetical protein